MIVHENTCLDNHGVFRTLLDGMARPGVPKTLPQARLGQGSGQTLIQLMQSVLDAEVKIAVVGEDAEGISATLSWQTGSPEVAVEQADFLLVPAGHSDGAIHRVKRGRLDYPDEGATVVYGVDRLKSNDSDALRLTGPGIDGAVQPGLAGLGAQELDGLREINQHYPLGVDAIFADGDGRILCLPRSTRIGGDHGVRCG